MTVRHRQTCSAPTAPCRCKPTFQAQVFSPRDRRTIRKSFASLSEARAWRADTQAALRHERVVAPVGEQLGLVVLGVEVDAADDQALRSLAHLE